LAPEETPVDIPKTIGFPRMMKESGGKRVFLPEFIQFLAGEGLTVFLGEGYGSGSGFAFDDYRKANLAVVQCNRRDVFHRDLILVLRPPAREDYALIPSGRCLITTLHFPTRPRRVRRLKDMGLRAVSLDGITDDGNLRLVENMKAVAWNGLEAAFDVLERRNADLPPPHAGPIRVLVLGAGKVGKHAVEAATKYGSVERNVHLMQSGAPGVVVSTIGRNISGNPADMEPLFRAADILVDATQRRDPSRPVVPNPWLPEHAVVTDMAVRSVRARSPAARRPRDRGNPAGEPRPIHLRARRPRLAVHHSGGNPRGEPADDCQLLLVAGHPPGSLHAALRPAAGTADGGPDRQRIRGAVAGGKLLRARPLPRHARVLAAKRALPAAAALTEPPDDSA
jgi:hypothetical protein